MFFLFVCMRVCRRVFFALLSLFPLLSSVQALLESYATL